MKARRNEYERFFEQTSQYERTFTMYDTQMSRRVVQKKKTPVMGYDHCDGNDHVAIVGASDADEGVGGGNN
jgi:hypothetical protein